MALSPLDLLLTTLRDLSGNWVRSGLTTLGIFMGVAAINTTLNIEAISANLIQQKLEARDNPFLTFWLYDPQKIKPTPELKPENLAQLQRDIPEIADIGQITWLKGTQVQHQGSLVSKFELLGVSANYQAITGRKILQGRFFEPIDYQDYRPVAIIDEILAEQLFQDQNPIGEAIFLDGARLTVVGLSESKNNWSTEEPTGSLWVPETYGYLIQGKRSAGSPQISLRRLQDHARLKTSIEQALRQTYPDFSVYFMSNAEDLYKEEQQQRASSRILQVVGLLALVVGGVGIANITVAAIVERTREIGLRRALGATDLEVMFQFIAEAAMLSCIGGAAAILVVHGVTKTATNTLFEVAYVFQPADAALSMGAAFVVGIGASFFPALRVTRIDVVQALRGE
jgi:putative ABC transport system permease protein